MSQECVETVRGVRMPLAISSKPGQRSLAERILLRVPAVNRMLAFTWSRLPPGSRLRRAMTAYNLRRAYEAANRRDFEVLLLSLDPQVEFQFDESPIRELVPPDLIGTHHGPDGYLRVWREGLEASEDYRLEPEEVFDRGDRILVVGHQCGHGTSSGIPFDEPLLTLFALRNGRVIRVKDFADRATALEAAGLSE